MSSPLSPTPLLLGHTAPLPPEAAYAVLQARDARFDGRIFVGVTSTGIYCRPVCRVRLPKRENCRFFASAAQAEAQRFRPCMKCRPELAPRETELAWTTMDASRTLARQASAWLDTCEDPEASIEQLADHLGITSRHLRRIFLAEHGVTPLQYLQTRRLLLAKALLTDSRLPVHDVAAAAGFASLRRFNAAFVQHYRLQPTQLRKTLPPTRTGCGEPALRLAYRAPLAVDALLAFLAARAIPEVERVDGDARRIDRSVSLDVQGERRTGRIVVQFDERAGEVLLSPCSALWPASSQLVPLVRRWLDLDADPSVIHEHLAPQFGTAFLPGLRLAGCVDRFELAVRAVLGQQVTVAAARTVAGRLVQAFGTPLGAGSSTAGVTRVFPAPQVLANASVAELASLGMPVARAEALQTLAQRWPTLRFARRASAVAGDVQAALDELKALPGIGPWTANYMLMRGWSWPDAFPPGDVVLRRVLSERAGRPLTPKACVEQAAPFSPFRSYAVLHLWRTS